MVKQKFIPTRGDVIWLDFNPQIGKEQAKRRPALVLSPAEYNVIGLAIIAPITTGIGLKGVNNFRVIIPKNEAVEGVIISDQVKSLDWQARDARKKCKLSDKITQEVIQKFSILLRS